MPTPLDNKARDKASEAINRVAGPGTLYARTVSSVDISQGSQSTSTEAISVKVTPPNPTRDQYVDGELIREGNSTALIAAKDLSVVPIPGWKIDLPDGNTYTIVSVQDIRASTLSVVYKLEVER